MTNTNQRLRAVLDQIDALIEWAQADAQQSEESGASHQAKDDRQRAHLMRQARATLAMCRKF